MAAVLSKQAFALTPTDQRKLEYISAVSDSFQWTHAGAVPFRPTSVPLWAEGRDDESTELYLSSELQRNSTISLLQDLYDQGDLRFWITEGETEFAYWTENHLIMWLAATWLLRPMLSFRENDNALLNLEKRLLHFLDTRLEYGAREFFSTNYYRYTLAALLNLADFAAEQEIRDKAIAVVSRLLEECLRFTTVDGSFFPVAGRNHYDLYFSRQYEGIIYILTGQGRVFNPKGSRDGEIEFLEPFLATTKVDLGPVADTWSPNAYFKFSVGHDFDELKGIHGSLNRDDRVMFQWAAGAIAQQSVVGDSKYFIEKWNIHDHKLLRGLGSIIAFVPTGVAEAATGLLPGQAQGTDLTSAHVTVFRNGGVSLSSLESYLVGSRGQQQWPWMASVNGVTVWTQAGITGAGFDETPVNGLAVNTHLPQVVQVENVALIAYRPRVDVYKVDFILNVLQSLPFLWDILKLPTVAMPTQVSLRFPTDEFDEVVENDRWMIGRRGDAYIGVWRHSLDQHESGLYFYSDPRDSERSQVWAAVVGTSQTHGSFAAFQASIQNARVNEHRQGLFGWLFSLFFGWLFGAWKYQTSVEADGTFVEVSI